MKVFNSFQEVMAGMGQNGRNISVNNMPHLRTEDGRLFVDFRIEGYFTDDIVATKTIQDELYSKVNGGQPFYAEIPVGFADISAKGLDGDIVYSVGDYIAVGFKGQVNLSGRIRLPDGWERSAKFV